MNKKLEKTFIIGVALASIGIIAFWVAGFKGNEQVAGAAFLFAGIMAGIALCAKTLDWFSNRNMSGC